MRVSPKYTLVSENVELKMTLYHLNTHAIICEACEPRQSFDATN